MSPPDLVGTEITFALLRVCRARRLVDPVQGKVEQEDVHVRLTEEAQHASSGVLLDELSQLLGVEPPSVCDALGLLCGVLGADVRVEPGPAGEQSVRRDPPAVDAVELGGCRAPFL